MLPRRANKLSEAIETKRELSQPSVSTFRRLSLFSPSLAVLFSVC